MNALVKKEIRLLLPSFAICCALALTNFFFRFNSDGSLVDAWCFILAFVFCGAVAVMLALNSFGAEIGSGAFSNLLAQPISRQQIWETKILLLAATLLIVGIFWSGCGTIRLKMIGHDLNLLDLFSGVVTFGLVVFSGGLWTVLLLRQVAAAFWFTLLVPGALMVILAAFFADHDGNFFEGMIISVLGLYSLAGFFFARWLFFRAQDVQWSGGTIVMPEMRGLARFKSAAALRSWRPRAALWRKEIMLHQSQYVMAFALIVLHLAVLAARHLVDKEKSPDMYFVLEIFWGLWLVMPVLVGCTAVAEERKIGTLEGQLCLPVKRRTEFAIKLSVVLLLSLFLGLIMPLLLEGKRILPGQFFGWPTGLDTSEFGHLPWSHRAFWKGLECLYVSLPLLTFAGIVLLIAGVSFYVSSLVCNTMQSLAPAVAGVIIAWLLLFAGAIPWERNIEFLWSGPLVYFICVPLMAATLVVLAFRNFELARPNWKTFGLNLLSLVSVLAFGATATMAIYHRTWEKLTSFEPAHGVAKLSLSSPAVLDDRWGGVSVLLPDGQFWRADYRFYPDQLDPLVLLLANVKPGLDPGKYFAGSNWRSVARLPFEYAGIQHDGSLWISEKPLPSGNRTNSQWQADIAKMSDLVRFGAGTNWTSLARIGHSLLLVKDDDTLWELGTNNFNFNRQRWPGLRTFVPRQMGTESNWADVVQNGYRPVLHKTDGTGWDVGDWQTNGVQSVEIEPGFVVHAVPGDDQGKFRSTATIQMGPGFRVGIDRNGTFRIWAEEHLFQDKKHLNNYYQWRPAEFQIGDGTNWLAVAGGGEKLVTLKDDGSLWLWNFHRNRFQGVPWNNQLTTAEIQSTIPVRLGTHSDWVAITGYWGSLVSLAADGSLWFWQLENAADYYGNNNQNSLHPLLEYSRKPVLLGNIFNSQN